MARCTAQQFDRIDADEYLRRRRSAMGGEELLVADRESFARRHPSVVLDNAGVEDIMLFYVKGERT